MAGIRPLLLLLCLLVLPAAASGSEEVLARLQRSAAGVNTLQSGFVQEKHLSVFNEVLLSRGRFLFARPDRLRWELTEPVAAGFVLDGSRGVRWHARTGRSEPFELEREPVMKLVAEQLIAWAAADFTRLRGEYRIRVLAEQPVILRLEPLATGGFLDHLRVAFAADGRHVTLVEVHEQGGDFTRIRFQEPQVNVPVPEGAFDPV